MKHMKNTAKLIGALIVILAIGLPACKPSKKSRSKVELDTYEEDLSSYRPVYDDAGTVKNPEKSEMEIVVKPTHHINEELDVALDSIADYNASFNYVQGYRLQVFLGKSREQALEIRDQLFQLLPEERPEVLYDQPNYKVKVGKYTERLEAQRAYLKVKEEFPKTIVIPERIRVNK